MESTLPIHSKLQWLALRVSITTVSPCSLKVTFSNDPLFSLSIKPTSSNLTPHGYRPMMTFIKRLLKFHIPKWRHIRSPNSESWVCYVQHGNGIYEYTWCRQYVDVNSKTLRVKWVEIEGYPSQFSRNPEAHFLPPCYRSEE